MDKKGTDERLILWIFYSVIAMVILLATMAFVNNAFSKTGFDEEYYARDLAYTLDLVFAGLGDVEYVYSIEDAKFDFFIGLVDGESKVVVGKSLSELGRGDGSKNYRYNSKQEFGKFDKPGELVIEKKEGKVTINGVILGLNLVEGEYLSELIARDEHGSYRWVVIEITESNVVVRKSYIPGITYGNNADEIEEKLAKYKEFIIAASGKYDISENMIKAVIWKESTGNEKSKNEVSGAIGLMQILPSTAGLSEEELFKPAINIDAGTKYLKEQLDKFQSEELALAAYNWGPTNVRRNCEGVVVACNKLPDETSNYVRLVIGYKVELDLRQGISESGHTDEIRIGELKKLDGRHTVRLVKLDRYGNEIIAKVEIV